MYRSASELQEIINRLIEEQGGDAPVAAFIFTKKDVFYYEMDDDGTNLNEIEVYLNEEDTINVLEQVGGCDYVYEQIGKIIDDEVRRIRKQNQ